MAQSIVGLGLLFMVGWLLSASVDLLFMVKWLSSVLNGASIGGGSQLPPAVSIPKMTRMMEQLDEHLLEGNGPAPNIFPSIHCDQV